MDNWGCIEGCIRGYLWGPLVHLGVNLGLHLGVHSGGASRSPSGVGVHCGDSAIQGSFFTPSFLDSSASIPEVIRPSRVASESQFGGPLCLPRSIRRSALKVSIWGSRCGPSFRGSIRRSLFPSFLRVYSGVHPSIGLSGVAFESSFGGPFGSASAGPYACLIWGSLRVFIQGLHSGAFLSSHVSSIPPRLFWSLSGVAFGTRSAPPFALGIHMALQCPIRCSALELLAGVHLGSLWGFVDSGVLFPSLFPLAIAGSLSKVHPGLLDPEVYLP